MIKTLTQRYQVFLSSTYKDLISERQRVMLSILHNNCIPVGMEFFPASNEKLWPYIQKTINDCEYYILVVGKRYGSTIKLEGKEISWTEREYDYAVENKKKILAYLYQDPPSKKSKRGGRKSNEKKLLENFCNKITKKTSTEGVMAGYWSSADKLEGLILSDLASEIKKNSDPGWVRVDQFPGWEIITLANEMIRDGRNYHRIIELFSKAKEQQGKLIQAFNLAHALLIVEEENRVKAKISKQLRGRYSTSMASGFFSEDNPDNKIRVRPEWGADYALLYAMCYISKYKLDDPKNMSFPMFDASPIQYSNWWNGEWIHVALYISQICCDEALNRGIVNLPPINPKHPDYSKAFALVYRIIQLRASDNHNIIKMLERIESHIPGDGKT